MEQGGDKQDIHTGKRRGSVTKEKDAHNRTSSAIVTRPESKSIEGTVLGDVETLKFYLKQGIELKNREALQVALDKVAGLASATAGLSEAERRSATDFFELVEHAKKLLATMDVEDRESIKYYLKTGTQTRNREVLKEAVFKAESIGVDKIDKELFEHARDALRELDAQHLVKSFLQIAISQKDDYALEETLKKANSLKMGVDVKEVAEATKLLEHLNKKAAKKKISLSSKLKSMLKGKKNKEGKEQAPLFGGPLSEAVKNSDRDVPKICYQCLEFLEAKALAEPGLFRVPGNKDAIEEIMSRYQRDEEVKLEDVHDAAGVLKQYLRMLPEPLIPFANYDNFIEIGLKYNAKDPKRIEKLKTLLKESVAKDSFALLAYLSRFLVKVTRYESANRMPAENLAIVFAPNLLRPRVETAQTMLSEMQVSISVISAFILHCDAIFGPAPPSTIVPITTTAGESSSSSSASSSSASHHHNASISTTSSVGGSPALPASKRLSVTSTGSTASSISGSVPAPSTNWLSSPPTSPSASNATLSSSLPDPSVFALPFSSTNGNGSAPPPLPPFAAGTASSSGAAGPSALSLSSSSSRPSSPTSSSLGSAAAQSPTASALSGSGFTSGSGSGSGSSAAAATANGASRQNNDTPPPLPPLPSSLSLNTDTNNVANVSSAPTPSHRPVAPPLPSPTGFSSVNNSLPPTPSAAKPPTPTASTALSVPWSPPLPVAGPLSPVRAPNAAAFEAFEVFAVKNNPASDADASAVEAQQPPPLPPLPASINGSSTIDFPVPPPPLIGRQLTEQQWTPENLDEPQPTQDSFAFSSAPNQSPPPPLSPKGIPVHLDDIIAASASSRSSGSKPPGEEWVPAEGAARPADATEHVFV